MKSFFQWLLSLVILVVVCGSIVYLAVYHPLYLAAGFLLACLGVAAEVVRYIIFVDKNV